MKEDEFGLNWGKRPFSRREAIEGVNKLLVKTEEKIRSTNNEQEKRQFKANALLTIELILKHCKRRFFIEEINRNSNLEQAYATIKEEFAFEKVNIENRNPFYVV